jgi:transcriptional regulator with XRE-family HTH domain
MKNPIAIIFGGVLRETRKELNIPIQELVDTIGINISYYRLLESGTHVIHISKTIDLVNAFNHFGANLNYEGVTKIIMGIYYTQSLIAETNKEIIHSKIETLLENLKELDNKLYILLQEFYNNGLFKLMPDGKFNLEKINSNELGGLVNQFLTNYTDYGKEEKVVINEKVQQIFQNLPTLYYEFVDNFINDLLNLPMGFRINDLKKWEDRNTDKQNIKSLYALIKYKDSIIDDNNFSKYKYKFLWDKSFHKANMVFITPLSKEQVQKEFKEKLYNAIKDSPNMRDGFDKAIEKLNISVVTISDEVSSKIFTVSDDPIEYNLAWVFCLQSNINVGLKAKVYFDNNQINEFRDFISLNYEDSQDLLNNIMQLQ